MMKAVWVDLDRDEVTLTDQPYEEDDAVPDFLFLVHEGEAVFAFDEDDAKSFGEYLLTWAKKPKEI